MIHPNQFYFHCMRSSSYNQRGGRGGVETQAIVSNDGPLVNPRFDIALLRTVIWTVQDALILSRWRRSSMTTQGRRSKRDYRLSGRRGEHASIQDNHDNDHGASDRRKMRDSAKKGSTSSILEHAHNLNKPTRALNSLSTQNGGRSINNHNMNTLQGALLQLDIEHP